MRRVIKAVNKMVKEAKSWRNPSVVIFLAFPMRRKSTKVKIPLAIAPNVEEPSNLTMKKDKGITMAEQKADGERSATYSIFGNVKFCS